MRKVLIGIAVLAAVLVVVFVVIGSMSPSSEVVTLTTLDASGEAHDTPVWVVDEGETQWLRGGPESGWMLRLKDNPEVELTRGGRSSYRAIPVDTAEARDRINAAMAEKYGASDTLVTLWADHDGSLPVRLEPR